MSEAAKLSLVTDTGELVTPHTYLHALNKLSVGEQLLLARTQQKLSIEHIADQSKWSLHQIAEIEAGRYAVLPDLSSLRGFVRVYAKLLKLDALPLLEQLSDELAKLPVKVVDRPLLDTPFPTGRMPWLGKQNSTLQRIFGGLFLVLLCVAIFVYRSEIALFLVQKGVPVGANSAVEHLSKREEKSENLITAPADSPRGKPNQDFSHGQRTVTHAKTVSMPASTSVSEATESPINSNKSFVANNIENVLKKERSSTPSVSLGKSGQEQNTLRNRGAVPNGDLVLNFKQDSWVQIKRLNNSVVVSRIYKAGSEKVVNVVEPLKLIIGNAPGVEVKLRGESLDLQMQNESRVINLSIK